MASTFNISRGENLLIQFALISLPEGSTFIGAWDFTHTYTLNDVVSEAGIYYISLANGNINHNPVSSPSFWTPLPVLSASDVLAVHAALRPLGTETESVVWKYKAGHPAPSDVNLADGLLKLELLSEDSETLEGHYDLAVELTTKSTLYIASGAQTDVDIASDVLNVT